MIRHLLREAFEALSHYKLRSVLTMLRVTWGIAALVLLLSYGKGFETALVGAFDQIGKDLIVIFPGQTSEQAGGERSGRTILLELPDVETLRGCVPASELYGHEIFGYFPPSAMPPSKLPMLTLLKRRARSGSDSYSRRRTPWTWTTRDSPTAAPG